MSAFSYIAYDGAGKRVKGVLVADGAAHARALLAEEGLFPEKLTETRQKTDGQRRALFQRATLSPENLAVFSRQMAVLLAAQIPVDTALDALMGAKVTGQVNRIAAQLQTHVRDGRTLSDAMAQCGTAYPDYYRAAVAAGENSGQLEQVFEVLAEFIESRLAMRDKTVTSLVYPLFVGAVSLLVAGILLMNVVPELALLFEQNGQELPQLTRVSIAVGDFLGANWPMLLIGIGLATVLVIWTFRRPGPRAMWHRGILRVPVFGSLAQLKAAVLYLRTLSLVLAANVPAVAAMKFATQAIDNLAIRAQTAEIQKNVEGGQRIGTALRKVPALPTIAVQMIESGERSGRLAEMARRAAQMLEFTLASRTQRIATLLEPIMMMLVGGLVLAIVLSVLLPIFDLQTSLAP